MKVAKLNKSKLTLYAILKGRKELIGGLALIGLMAILVGVASPPTLDAQSQRTLNLGSLSIIDANGKEVDFGAFDPAVLTYSAKVDTSVRSVAVTARPESDSGVRWTRNLVQVAK